MTSTVQSSIGPEKCERIQLTIHGIVQGIGFRPFVFRLAQDLSLSGWIANTTHGALLELEGPQIQLQTFQKRVMTELPRSGSIQSITSVSLPILGEQSFSIHSSHWHKSAQSILSPDLATCNQCLDDINNPLSRRYRYPFTTCAECGPRFSIALRLPYDRANTTMEPFVFCPECQREYNDPSDRRYHAETMACPTCGPQVEFWNHHGHQLAQGEEALQAASHMLKQGDILAVKSLGGFQLWVSAESSEAVQQLRHRKHRPTKPFAVLFPSLDCLKRHCLVSPDEIAQLTSPAAPIVILKKRRQSTLACEVAPNNPYVGAILPYTPLHHLLTHDLFVPVIATSGNRSEEPLVIDERDAVYRLRGIADAFLVHNRPIVRPLDDSVVQVVNHKALMRRRARGYVPTPLSVQLDSDEDLNPSQILAVGGHLKNTVAITTGNQIIVSQHIGDLSTPEASIQFERTISDLLALFHMIPRAIVCDRHPDYHSARFAHQYAKDHNIPVVPIQHHQAHIAACIAEHGLQGPVLGVVWDGAGLGLDKTIWGGEFLLCDGANLKRLAHLRPFRLPGGEVCMREPHRVALALLHEVFGKSEQILPLDQALDPKRTRSLIGLLDKEVNCPYTTSIGRLFEGVSSLLGLSQVSSFEGEAAMALEYLAYREGNSGRTQPYPLPLKSQAESQDQWVADWRPLISGIVEDLTSGQIGPSEIALRFHHTLAMLISDVTERIKCPQVVLSGGVFQNTLLLALSEKKLTKHGFKVYTPQQYGSNDGALSLGQAFIASHRFTHKNQPA